MLRHFLPLTGPASACVSERDKQHVGILLLCRYGDWWSPDRWCDEVGQRRYAANNTSPQIRAEDMHRLITREPLSLCRTPQPSHFLTLGPDFILMFFKNFLLCEFVQACKMSNTSIIVTLLRKFKALDLNLNDRMFFQGSEISCGAH